MSSCRWGMNTNQWWVDRKIRIGIYSHTTAVGHGMTYFFKANFVWGQRPRFHNGVRHVSRLITEKRRGGCDAANWLRLSDRYGLRIGHHSIRFFSKKSLPMAGLRIDHLFSTCDSFSPINISFLRIAFSFGISKQPANRIWTSSSGQHCKSNQ